MYSTARIVVMWTGRHDVQITLDGLCDRDALDRLDRIVDQILRAGARHISVDITRVRGRDTPLLELLAATCHRLWKLCGCLRVTGLGRRLASAPEVTAFPEVFGHLDDAAASDDAE